MKYQEALASEHRHTPVFTLLGLEVVKQSMEDHIVVILETVHPQQRRIMSEVPQGFRVDVASALKLGQVGRRSVREIDPDLILPGLDHARIPESEELLKVRTAPMF